MSNNYGSIQAGRSQQNNVYRQDRNPVSRREDSGRDNGFGKAPTVASGAGNNNQLQQLVSLITQLLQQFQGGQRGNEGTTKPNTDGTTAGNAGPAASTTPSNMAGTITGSTTPLTTPAPVPAAPMAPAGTPGMVAGAAGSIGTTPNPGATGIMAPGYMPGTPGMTSPAYYPQSAYPQNPGEIVYTKPNTAVTIDGLANDTNPATNAILDFTAPQNGTVRIDNNKLVYTPNADFQGYDSFMYLTNDGARASVNVDVGSGPYLYTQGGKGSAVDDYANTGNTTPVRIDVLANDFNSAGNLQLTGFTQPQNGTVTQDGNSLIFTPNKNRPIYSTTETPATAGTPGSDTSFSYTTNNGGSASVQVNVSYPWSNQDQAKTDINTPVSVDVLANDYNPNGMPNTPQGTPLTLTGATQATHGSVAINGNNVVYTPDQGFAGIDNFSYQTAEGSRADVNVSVGQAQSLGFYAYSNQIGNAVADVQTTPVNTPVSINVLKNDYNAGGNAAIKSFEQPYTGGTVTQNGNALVFNPAQDFQGYTGFSYTREDNSVGQVNLLVGQANIWGDIPYPIGIAGTPGTTGPVFATTAPAPAVTPRPAS